jgi:hypothetical protein
MVSTHFLMTGGSNMKKNKYIMYVIVAVNTFLINVGCQPQAGKLPNIPSGNELTFLYINAELQGNVSGYKCKGTTNKIAENMQDCGGEQNVESVLFDQSSPIYSLTIEQKVSDTMSGKNTIGSWVGKVSFPPSILTTYGNSALIPLKCHDCTLDIEGSSFNVSNMLLSSDGSLPKIAPSNLVNSTARQRLRTVGCLKLVETSGKGSYANKQGTICGTSTLRIDENLHGAGSANYKIELHNLRV